MSVPAEVSARPEVPERAAGVVRVRPPSPLPPRRRAVIAVITVLLAVLGGVLVAQARSADGGAVPQLAWRDLPVPRAARIDAFDQAGPLADLDGFGRWQTGNSALQASDGALRSGDGEAIATIDASSSEVLVHAQIARMAPGGGLVLSASPDGASALILRVTGIGGWELAWRRPVAPPQVFGTFAAPTEDISVQVVHRGGRVKVAIGDQVFDIDVSSVAAPGTFVGIASKGPGNELELFGYLPLDAG